MVTLQTMTRFKTKDAPAHWNAQRCSWPLKYCQAFGGRLRLLGEVNAIGSSSVARWRFCNGFPYFLYQPLPQTWSANLVLSPDRTLTRAYVLVHWTRANFSCACLMTRCRACLAALSQNADLELHNRNVQYSLPKTPSRGPSRYIAEIDQFLSKSVTLPPTQYYRIWQRTTCLFCASCPRSRWRWRWVELLQYWCCRQGPIMKGCHCLYSQRNLQCDFLFHGIFLALVFTIWHWCVVESNSRRWVLCFICG